MYLLFCSYIIVFILQLFFFFFFFFFNDTATTEIYTLSLHDALPISAPGDAVDFDGAYAYPADGSIVAVASVTTSVSATSGVRASAGASSQVTSLSLFKGEITAASVTGETHALASTASAGGDTGVTGVTALVVLGQPVTPTANQQIALGDWGYAI